MKCGCIVCSTARAKARRRHLSRESKTLLRVFNNSLLATYGSVKSWFALTDRQVRRGLKRLASGAGTPISKATPVDYQAVQIADWLADWGDAAEQGAKRYVGPHQVKVYGQAMGQAALLAKIKTPWDLCNRRAVEWAGRYVTPHMKDLVMETRAGLATLVRDGLDRGQSVQQVAREMRRLPSFAMNPRQARALGGYRARLEAVQDRVAAALAESGGNLAAAGRALRGKVPQVWIKQVRDGRFDVAGRTAKEAGRKVRYRAEMIARTETARAMSEGTLEGYAEAHVERVRWEAAGDCCDVCAGYDGTVYNRGEAEGLIPEHVNCRCCWVPETEVQEAVAPVVQPMPEEAMPEAEAPIAVPPTAAPVMPETVLSSGEIESVTNLGGGANESKVIHIKGDGDGVYKPKSGERRHLREEMAKGSYYKRERAAYLVDQELGFDLVPETVIRNGPQGIGSVQKFVENAVTAGESVNAEGLVSQALRESGFIQDQKTKMNVLDVLISNTDRHSANYMLIQSGEQAGRYVAIDNGLCFIGKHTPWWRLGVNESEMFSALPQEMVRKLEAFKIRRRIIEKKLTGLLKPAERQAMFKRLDWILKNKDNSLEIVDKSKFWRWASGGGGG